LKPEHLAGVGLVVITAEVQDAVDRSFPDILAALGADDDVTELARAGNVAGTVERKCEHIGGAIATPVLAVQLPNPLLPDDLHRQVALVHSGGVECGRDRLAELHRDVREVRGQLELWRSE
jgi:hypothetical protein